MDSKFKVGYSRMTGCTIGNHREYDRGFSNGQQSKQAEIDALKAKLEDITKWAEFHIEDYNLSESDSEHDRGWFNAACQVFKSLKGESRMTPEQMQKIVDGAPEWAKSWDGFFYTSDYMQGAVRISDLHTELAKREPMDLRDVDIPHGTIVLEK